MVMTQLTADHFALFLHGMRAMHKVASFQSAERNKLEVFSLMGLVLRSVKGNHFPVEIILV